MTKQTKNILIGVLMTLPAVTVLLSLIISAIGLKGTFICFILVVLALLMCQGIVKILNPNEGD
jgi:hypothetical protein